MTNNYKRSNVDPAIVEKVRASSAFQPLKTIVTKHRNSRGLDTKSSGDGLLRALVHLVHATGSPGFQNVAAALGTTEKGTFLAGNSTLSEVFRDGLLRGKVLAYRELKRKDGTVVWPHTALMFDEIVPRDLDVHRSRAESHGVKAKPYTEEEDEQPPAASDVSDLKTAARKAKYPPAAPAPAPKAAPTPAPVEAPAPAPAAGKTPAPAAVILRNGVPVAEIVGDLSEFGTPTTLWCTLNGKPIRLEVEVL